MSETMSEKESSIAAEKNADKPFLLEESRPSGRFLMAEGFFYLHIYQCVIMVV